MHYILKVPRYKSMDMYKALTYMNISCSLFVSFSPWSVNYTSFMSKFHIFLGYAVKLRQIFYLRAFSIVIYEQFNSNFPVLFKFFSSSV